MTVEQTRKPRRPTRRSMHDLELWRKESVRNEVMPRSALHQRILQLIAVVLEQDRQLRKLQRNNTLLGKEVLAARAAAQRQDCR